MRVPPLSSVDLLVEQMLGNGSTERFASLWISRLGCPPAGSNTGLTRTVRRLGKLVPASRPSTPPCPLPPPHSLPSESLWPSSPGTSRRQDPFDDHILQTSLSILRLISRLQAGHHMAGLPLMSAPSSSPSTALPNERRAPSARPTPVATEPVLGLLELLLELQVVGAGLGDWKWFGRRVRLKPHSGQAWPGPDLNQGQSPASPSPALQPLLAA